MDPMALAGMLFVLIMVAMIGGVVLLLPISRRLGKYLEQRLDAGRGAGADPAKLGEVKDLILSLQAQIDRVAERQEFTERLLAERTDSQPVAGALRGERH